MGGAIQIRAPSGQKEQEFKVILGYITAIEVSVHYVKLSQNKQTKKHNNQKRSTTMVQTFNPSTGE